MIRYVSHLRIIITIGLLYHAIAQKCQTMTDHDGICIPIRDCNSVLQQLAHGNITDNDKQEIRELQCEYRNGTPYVCCDLNTLYPYRAVVERFNSSNVKESSKLGNIFPTLSSCGVDLSSENYRINDVGMYEHPGMVLLKYENQQFGCGGTLINQRYVLTAASCVSGDIVQKLGKLKSVRIGEHDLAIDPECDYLDVCQNYVECDVAEIVVSKNFILNAQYDLGLIRLVDDVDTTKYQPVCLSELVNLYRDTLRVVGWGISFNNKNLSKRKYLEMDYVNETECHDIIKRQGSASSHLPSNPICTKRQMLGEKSLCPLDGGGVLLARSKNHHWTVVGVASYQPSCGAAKQLPAIFTDVSYHIDWIQYNVRP